MERLLASLALLLAARLGEEAAATGPAVLVFDLWTPKLEPCCFRLRLRRPLLAFLAEVGDESRAVCLASGISLAAGEGSPLFSYGYCCCDIKFNLINYSYELFSNRMGFWGFGVLGFCGLLALDENINLRLDL